MTPFLAPHPEAIQAAACCIQQGGIVAYPTEGVYGLGCCPRNEQALSRLIALKQRPQGAGFILIAAEVSFLSDWVDFDAIPAEQRDKMLQKWPGPVTWICPARTQHAPALMGKHSSLAVRVTAHPVAAALSRAVQGPIVSTSANRHGQAPARAAIDVSTLFDNAIDMILAGQLGDLSAPTPIIDALTGKIIR